MDENRADNLLRILSEVGSPNVLVIGDLMLDKYIWGAVRRTSPEAPIPVLNVTSQESKPGGAGSVVNNLCHLRANVTCCGVVGNDSEGRALRRELEKLGCDTSGVFQAEDRPTTVKTRMLGHVQSAHRAVQQLLRVDYENASPVDAKMEDRLCSYLVDRVRARDAGSRPDIILASDYDKGVLTTNVLRHTSQLGRDHGISVIADPKLAQDYSLYSGVTAITPNRYETEIATGVKLSDVESLRAAGKKLLEDLHLDCAIITMDRDGMFFFRADGEYELIRTTPKEVYDVTGAGDMVLSVLGLTVGSGNTFRDSVTLANIAAGIEVRKVGAMPVTREEIHHELARMAHLPSKIKTAEELLPELNERRRRGERTAFTNGCFDMLHFGHIQTLRFARSQADLLVVGVNTDSSIRRQKGESRPIIPEHERAQILAALEIVDYVILFSETSVEPLIRKIKPDVIVKGGDITKGQIVGWEFVESYGGKAVNAPLVEGISTTDTITRIVERLGNEP